MNIFKVIASSGTTFREKFTSSILAWLLNPAMEHGLGFSFMEAFIRSIEKEKFSGLINKLRLSLENNDSIENVDWMCSLEFNVKGTFIDVVFVIDDWIFAIENKIYSSSATNNQLNREYQGLRKDDRSKNYKICMVYLVPISGDLLEKKIESEYQNLEIEEKDCKAIMTWQSNILKIPSFSRILSSVIWAEHACKIEPIHEYTRHTLKALVQFVENGFQGYEKSINETRSGTPFEKRCTIHELKNIITGSVGYNDLNWMIEGKQKMPKYRFKYSPEDLSHKAQWLKVEDFNKLIEWLVEGRKPLINWAIWKSITAKNIYVITEKYKDVFIGIRGGLQGLEKLTNDEILCKRWQVGSEEISSEWIKGKEYHDILKKKNVFGP